MDLFIFLTAAGGLLLQAGDSAVISDWLSMDEPDAITAIRAQVDSSTAADLERLDTTLLTLASTHFDPAVRVQLVVASRPGGPPRAALRGQNRPAEQFLRGWARDFITVLAPPAAAGTGTGA